MSTGTASTRPPPHVPHHRLVRAIGRGSYGEIWLARSITAWRAVKIVDRRRFEDSRSFDREFDGMAKFEPISREHEGFVDILHIGRSEDDSFFYYVMELADDAVQRPIFDPDSYQPKTLKSELQRVARLPAGETIALGLSLTTALSALHRHGLAHRDIKPANIIFCGGLPKIADIGLVSAMGQQSFVGTEGYVPPEGPGSAQADLYSLGKVLYEIGMGKDRLEFPALHTKLDELPDRSLLLRLNDVLLRACAQDCSTRYSSSVEMHYDLLRARDGKPLLSMPGRRRRWPLAALAVAGLGTVAWWKMGTPPPVGRGAVIVESEPPGAMVVFDGKMRTTPARFDDVPAGTHRARVMLPDYDPFDLPFDVETSSEAHPTKVTLVRSMGTAHVETKPAGCSFELWRGDEIVQKGEAPLDCAHLPTGSYKLVARHGTHQKHTVFEVKRNDTTPVMIEFGSRVFTITSTPPGAEILADGNRVGIAPCEVVLAEGPHEFTARYRSWPAEKRMATEDSPAAIAFAFRTGSVKLTSAPTGAMVFAGAEHVGITPLVVEDIEPGEVCYRFEMTGFKPAELTTNVESGKQVFLGARFERRPGPLRGEAWENTLGMKFVPVGDLLVGVWPTRVQDYMAFCEATGRARLPVDFPQDGTHPQVRVNWEDATGFCAWLTSHEQALGKLDDGQSYRLPTDAEWSAAAGMPEERGATPEQRDGLVRDFPWGKAWPPPAGSGNFADAALKAAGLGGARSMVIQGYQDGFPQTAPTGRFPANPLGLHDMCGNVWQWVADSYNGGTQRKDWGVLRGGSWGTAQQNELRLGYRDVVDRSERDVIFGFRVVLVPGR